MYTAEEVHTWNPGNAGRDGPRALTSSPLLQTIRNQIKQVKQGEKSNFNLRMVAHRALRLSPAGTTLRTLFRRRAKATGSGEGRMEFEGVWGADGSAWKSRLRTESTLPITLVLRRALRGAGGGLNLCILIGKEEGVRRRNGKIRWREGKGSEGIEGREPDQKDWWKTKESLKKRVECAQTLPFIPFGVCLGISTFTWREKCLFGGLKCSIKVNGSALVDDSIANGWAQGYGRRWKSFNWADLQQKLHV